MEAEARAPGRESSCLRQSWGYQVSEAAQVLHPGAVDASGRLPRRCSLPSSAEGRVPLAPHLPGPQRLVNGSSRMYCMQKHPRDTAMEEGT